jgi:hypothetical protein
MLPSADELRHRLYHLDLAFENKTVGPRAQAIGNSILMKNSSTPLPPLLGDEKRRRA